VKAVIAGGGIGGLTAALCLHHHGHDATILEASDALTEVGAGIQISPNGMKVFAALGLADDVARVAFAPEALEMRSGRTGRQVFQIPITEKERARWGGPYLHVHRADLVDVLAAAVRTRMPGAVELSARATGYRQSDSSASVTLAGGREVAGDLIIGADGIHSAIRAQMLGADAPDFTGNVAWRAVVPMEALGDLAPPPTACVWTGPGRHCVTYRLRGGALANLVAVVERDDWQRESWTEEGTRDEALADFDGWHPVLTNLLNKADRHFRWALFDRQPLPTWTDGRVTILGDAAHPMLPFMAQGAVMAIEDAWSLAAALNDVTTVAADVQHYQDRRLGRTAKVQAAARANAKTFHKRTILEQVGTYGPMWLAGKLAPAVVHTRNDWLYGYDVTAVSA